MKTLDESFDPKQTHVAVQWKYDPSPLMACQFDPAGEYVLASAEDCSIQRWKLADGSRSAFVAHDSWVRDMTFLSGGDSFVSAASDDRLIWWPTAEKDPKPIRSVVAHKGWIRATALSRDGKVLASAGNDNIVKLWEPDSGKLIRELSGHESNVYSLAFHPDGKSLISGDLMGQAHHWDFEAGKKLRTFDSKALHTYNGGQQVHYGGVRNISFTPDGKLMACCGLHKASNPLGAVNEPIVLQFDWESGKNLRSHVAGGVKGIGWRAFFVKDGSLLCASGGSGGGFLIFWKKDSDKEYHKLKLPDTARDMRVHPDGVRVATAHYDRHIRICKMAKKA